MTKHTRYGGEGCVVGFGLDYACAHIIILAEISSENLLPIRADFVTERDIRMYSMQKNSLTGFCPEWME